MGKTATKRKQKPIARIDTGEPPQAFEQRARESGACLDAAIVQRTRELYWEHLRATGDPEAWNRTFLALIAARKQELAEEKARQKRVRALSRAENDQAIRSILGPEKQKTTDWRVSP